MDDGRTLCVLQYGPSDAFPRARDLPAGPPGEDAVLVTCAFLVDPNSRWALQSLLLAAIGETRDAGRPALEAFAYRYPPSATPDERFLVLQMHELLSYLNQVGVLTILVLAQHGLLGHMQTPIDLSYLSDAVIMLRYFEAGGRVRRAISVVKKRSGTHENTIREFQLTSEGLKVSAPLTDFNGILTGTPTYVGGPQPLMPEESNGR